MYCFQGINLTAAVTVMGFNPDNDKQAEVRYYGDGWMDGSFAGPLSQDRLSLRGPRRMM
jgi:hypothetical protein